MQLQDDIKEMVGNLEDIHSVSSPWERLSYHIVNRNMTEAIEAGLRLISPREARFILFAVDKFGKPSEEAYQYFNEHIPHVRRNDVIMFFWGIQIRFSSRKNREYFLKVLREISTQKPTHYLLKVDMVVSYKYISLNPHTHDGITTYRDQDFPQPTSSVPL